MKEKKNQFSGQIGFVLAAAGSAVGVGNLWRFPYLAAKDGGGLFLIVYLALVLTFGFALLTSDIAIGRKTQKSAIGAYEEMQPKWKFLGILTFLVPVLIMTYYAVIGGWITKYAVVYFTGQASAAAQDGFFTDFITSPVSPVVFALLSTILIGWVKTPQYVIGEMERNGEHFRRKGVYTIMIRYIAPVMMFVLFLQSTGILS